MALKLFPIRHLTILYLEYSLRTDSITPNLLFLDFGCYIYKDLLQIYYVSPEAYNISEREVNKSQISQ